MTELLLFSIKLSVSALLLTIGMGAKVADVTYLWRRPRLLLPALAAMYVFVPLAALLIVKIMPLGQGAEIALLVLAVSSGAPLLPRTLERFGSGRYIFSLLVTSSLLAMVIVPAWIILLASRFGVTPEFSMFDVAALIAKAILVPLVIGMAIGALAPVVSDRIADRLSAIAGAILIITCLVLIAMHWQYFMELRGSGIAALVILMVIAIAIGHVLGGSQPEHRTALAIACGTRHVGIAVVIAGAFPGPRILVLLAAYVICSGLVSIPYLRWRSRKMPHQSSGDAA